MRSTYHNIYFDLKEAIVTGTYRYKDMLPSEAALVARYACAHNTVRKAIAALSREGFVMPIHGKGVRVLYHSSEALGQRLDTGREPAGFEAFRDMGVRTGFEPLTKVYSMKPQVVDAEFARFSGFEPGDTVLKIKRVRHFDGAPLERETNYFRNDCVEGITRADVERSVYHYIEEVRGGRLFTAKRVLTIDAACEEDFELLDMRSDTNVVEIANVVYDSEGLVCELSLCRHVPRQFSFSQTVVRTALNS